MKDYKIKLDDVVYVLLQPTKNEPYRYATGIVRKIWHRHEYRKDNSIPVDYGDCCIFYML